MSDLRNNSPLRFETRVPKSKMLLPCGASQGEMMYEDDPKERFYVVIAGSVLLTIWTCLVYKLVTGEWMPLI